MALTAPTADLTGNTIASTYDQLLILDSAAGIVENTLKIVSTQLGHSALQLDDEKVLIKGVDTNNAAAFQVTNKDDANILKCGANTLDVTLGDDLLLNTDSSVIKMGAGADVTFTHDGTTGLAIIATPVTINSVGDLTLVSTTDIALDAMGGNFEFRDSTAAQLTIDVDGTAGDIDINLKVNGDDLVFNQYDGTEVMRITDTVRVGIGATSPTATLHVDATGTAWDATEGLAIFEDDSGRQIVIGQLGIFRRDYNNDEGEIKINYTGYNGGTTRYRDLRVYDGKQGIAFAVDGSAGAVGIGTIYPVNTIDVRHNGADSDNGIMIVNEQTTITDGELLGAIGFDGADGNVPSTCLEASCFIAAYAAEDHATIDKGGDLVFGNSLIDENDDVTSTEHMRIDSEGVVTTPGATVHTITSVNNLSVNGSIPITATCVRVDANGSARTGIRFGGTGIAGQIIFVNNTGGEALTFHNTEGTALVRGIAATHDTMEANFMGMFVSDGSLWNLIAGGVDSQPDVGLTAS